MSKCPNCNYTLVLLEHRRKYKCPKCGRLFSQLEIEIKEFNQFNKQERIKDKEVVEVNKGRKYKQPKLTEFQRKQNALACGKRYYLKNKNKVLSKQRLYRLISGPLRNQRMKISYHSNIDASRLKSRLRYWRNKQKELALLFLENEGYKAYNDDLSSKWLTYSLS